MKMSVNKIIKNMYGVIKKSELNWILKVINKRSCLFGLYLLINEEIFGLCRGCNKAEVLEAIVKLRRRNEKIYKKIKDKYIEMNEFKDEVVIEIIIEGMKRCGIINQIDWRNIEKGKIEIKKRYKIPKLNDIVDMIPEKDRKRIIKEKKEKIKIEEWRRGNENRKSKNK